MAKNNKRAPHNDRASTPTGTPTGTPKATTPKPILVKQTSERASCLCSPTTHTGSFRCRYHRTSFSRSSASIGSGLSDLATGSSVGSDLSKLSNKVTASASAATCSNA